MTFKKRVVVTALAVSLSFAAVNIHPKKADAIVGIATGNVAAIVVGAVMTVAGAVVWGADFRYPPTEILGGLLGIAGIVILDDQGQPKFTFPELTQADAAQMKLSGTELSAYLSQRDEINTVVDNIAGDMTRTGNTTSEYAKSEWTAFQVSLSPDAFSAVQKVSSYYVDQAKLAASVKH